MHTVDDNVVVAKCVVPSLRSTNQLVRPQPLPIASTRDYALQPKPIAGNVISLYAM